jgi:LmbE family N-acetylglucosaminyl deacetylase
MAAADELGIGAVHLFNHPDGHLSTVDIADLAADIQPLATGSELLLVFDEGGITGHPDHIHATASAMAVADRLDVPVVAWTLDHRVADTLNEEFNARFVGRRDRDIDLRLPVDRSRQRAAIRCHQSQLDGNPIPARRIALTGEHEALRVLRYPGR